jgi:hypothetical protein
MKMRGIYVLALGLVGAGFGFLFSRASEYGWLASRWVPIDQPPEDVQDLVAANADALWIRGQSGAIWELQPTDNCDVGCWKQVNQIPVFPTPDPWVMSLDPFPCAPARPLIGARDSVGECRREAWLRRNSVFALRGRRSILFWEAEIGMEWAFMNELCTTSFGALAGVAVAMGFLLALRSEAGPPGGDVSPPQSGVP